jgi:hypothetical protein
MHNDHRNKDSAVKTRASVQDFRSSILGPYVGDAFVINLVQGRDRDAWEDQTVSLGHSG